MQLVHSGSQMRGLVVWTEKVDFGLFEKTGSHKIIMNKWGKKRNSRGIYHEVMGNVLMMGASKNSNTSDLILVVISPYS